MADDKMSDKVVRLVVYLIIGVLVYAFIEDVSRPGVPYGDLCVPIAGLPNDC